MVCRWLLPLGAFLLVITVVLGHPAVSKKKLISEIFVKEFDNYRFHGIKTPHLKVALDHLTLPQKLRFGDLPDIETKAFTVCTVCDAVISAFVDYYLSGKTAEELGALLLDACVTLNIETEAVCSGLIESNIDTVIYILNNTPNLTVDRVCGVIFQALNCAEDDPSFDWSLDIDLGEKPEGGGSEDSDEDEVLTIIHLSDIHYDPTYIPGGNANCVEPTCCRSDEGEAPNEESAAGYWGDYRSCDVPLYSITGALQEIVSEHPDIDCVYFTGDVIDHGVWATSIGRNNQTFYTIFPALREAFGDIPVFPTFGNHEPHPFNVFAPNEITDPALSTAWLYETMAQLWSAWLPEDALSTLVQGGYYTTLLRPGLRVIVLNNIHCYILNWWIYYNPVDPTGQLRQLAETLLAAEAAGEKVHILMHIPSSSTDCLSTWTREYNKIIDRFEYTIAAQFNGHSHRDLFYLQYSSEDTSRVSTAAFSGGSITTYTNYNSNYKLYSVNARTGSVLDAESWIYNLTEANLTPDLMPVWYRLYSFTEAYGVSSMNLTELNDLVHRMAEQPDLIDQYNRFSRKNADPALQQGCDTNCLKDVLCNIVTSYYLDTTQCDELTASWDTGNLEK